MDIPQRVGRYDIVGLLATGGMAEILLGKLRGPAGFQRPVVIKRVLPHLARQARFRKMFLDEARIVSALRHPNIVQVHELGQSGSDMYLVMEYLEGESLAALFKRVAVEGTYLDYTLLAHIGAEACAGLHAAHDCRLEDGSSQKLVHRDVSPHNIFVTYDGTVKIIDFGIAKTVDQDSQTATGVLKGKYAYMSPEQCKGGVLDRTTDIFALGIIIHEALTGRRLFKRESELETMRAICEEAVPLPSSVREGVPKELERICMRALSTKREDRYQTANEMRRDLIRAARELDPQGLHTEQLGEIMRQFFIDRASKKRDMLRRVQAGSAVTHIPGADPEESDLSVDGTMGAVEVATRTGTSFEYKKRRRALPVFLAAASLLLAGGLGYWWTTVDRAAAVDDGGLSADDRAAESPNEPAEADPVELDTLVVEPEQPESPWIRVGLSTLPAGATVLLNDTELGSTPGTFDVPRGDEEITLILRKDGFDDMREVIMPDQNQRLRSTLVQERRVVVRPTGQSHTNTMHPTVATMPPVPPTPMVTEPVEPVMERTMFGRIDDILMSR